MDGYIEPGLKGYNINKVSYLPANTALSLAVIVPSLMPNSAIRTTILADQGYKV